MKDHKFTRMEIYQAEHDLEAAIKKYFGEVWRIKSDGEYKGVDWWCYSPIAFYGGIWRLCQAAVHKGGKRAAGRIEVKEAGHCLRFMVLYDKKEGEITI